MIVAEMRPADVPVEILGLEIERENVGQQGVERAGDVLDGVGAEIGRRLQARRALCAAVALLEPMEILPVGVEVAD